MIKILEGDIVKLAHSERYPDSPNFRNSLVGKEGRVVTVREHDILVCWNGWDGGHDGYLPEKLNRKYNITVGSDSYWYVREDEIVLVGGIVENE